MKQNRKASYLIALVSMAALIGFDQITKQLAVTYLKDKPDIIIWKGVFQLQYLENRGMAFGLLQNKRIFFIIMTAIVLALVVVFFMKVPFTSRFRPLVICVTVITAGAIGNLIDRVVNGYVIDFFYFSLINFPIFNVADIYVTVMFFVLVYLLFIYYKEEDLAEIGKIFKKEN